MSEIDRLLSAALMLSDTTNKLAAETWFGDLSVTYKADGSSLTKSDTSIEERWRDRIRQVFPTHGILGEEFGADTGTSAYTWVLDPIDGTRQFGAGLLNYASLISLCRDGDPILGIIDLPLPGARYVAAKDQGTTFAGRSVRTSGQADLSAAVVSLANPDSFQSTSAVGYRRLRAAGRVRVFDGGSPVYGSLSRGLIDVCLNGDDLDAYDICALCPVVQEAGGVITDWSGRPLSMSSSGAIVATASPGLHRTVLDLLAQPG